jgi:outer membrane protein assembly factor BamB
LLVFSAAKTGTAANGEGLAAYTVDAKCAFKRAWQTPTGKGVQPPPIVVGKLVFTSAGSGGLYAVDGANGHVVWHQATDTPASAPLSAGAGRVYAPVGSTLEAIAAG